MALRSIVDCSDLILVVGDPRSSNSNRLCEVAHLRNVPSYLINIEHEIDPKWLQAVKVLGLTAGASTPEDVVQRCIKKLQEYGVTEIEDIIYTIEDVYFHLPRQLTQCI
mgnify:FL=1